MNKSLSTNSFYSNALSTLFMFSSTGFKKTTLSNQSNLKIPKTFAQDHLISTPFTKVDLCYNKDVDIDTFLIKLLTLSLEFHFIPIKKVSMIYTKVLANVFSYQSSNGKNKIFVHPVTIFNDSALQSLPTDNTLEENYL